MGAHGISSYTDRVNLPSQCPEGLVTSDTRKLLLSEVSASLTVTSDSLSS